MKTRGVRSAGKAKEEKIRAKKSVYFGKTPLLREKRVVGGAVVRMDGESFFKISNVDAMPPFFMSLVSDSDHWMFLSSNGALTAGRKNPDLALFPYYTDDRIHDSSGQTGGFTLAFVTRSGKTFFWEPFLLTGPECYRVERNLYKNRIGNRTVLQKGMGMASPSSKPV